MESYAELVLHIMARHPDRAWYHPQQLNKKWFSALWHAFIFDFPLHLGLVGVARDLNMALSMEKYHGHWKEKHSEATIDPIVDEAGIIAAREKFYHRTTSPQERADLLARVFKGQFGSHRIRYLTATRRRECFTNALESLGEWGYVVKVDPDGRRHPSFREDHLRLAASAREVVGRDGPDALFALLRAGQKLKPPASSAASLIERCWAQVFDVDGFREAMRKMPAKRPKPANKATPFESVDDDEGDDEDEVVGVIDGDGLTEGAPPSLSAFQASDLEDVEDRWLDYYYGRPGLPPPTGNKNPEIRDSVVGSLCKRSAAVRAFARYLADGNCQKCQSNAPFIGKDRRPYLEVHHLHRLADGGPDTPENTVAVCPNCHRALHYSKDAETLTAALKAIVAAKLAEFAKSVRRAGSKPESP